MTILADEHDLETGGWDAAATTVGQALRPGAAEADRLGVLPAEAFDRLRDAGLTRALVPEEFGGGGATHAELGQMLRILGRHDPAIAVTLSMHSHLVAFQVWRHHHGQDASALFEKVVGGAILVSTGASDWVGSNGTATPVDGGYRVSARKAPASGCEVGNVLVTSIRWDDAPDGAQVLHCAIPMQGDGVRIEQTWDTLGLRATGSHTVVLEDVFVPAAAIALTRPADVWHPVWNAIAGAALPLIMSAYVGIADAAVATALEAVQGRTDPHVVQLTGEMLNAHTTGADVVDAMFAESRNLHFDNTDDVGSRAFMRKTVAADALIESVRLAVELVGGQSYTRSSDLERLYRDVHGCLFHPLGRAKQLQLSGRVALGLPPVG